MNDNDDIKDPQKPQLTVDMATDETEAQDATASTFVVGAPDEPADATDKADDEAEKTDDKHPTLGEVVARRATEEDSKSGPGVSLADILGGEILNTSTVRKQIWLLLLIAFFIIVYISNRYSYEQEMIRLSRLTTELKEIRYKQRAATSELTELTRKSKVLELLQQCQDSTLRSSNEPPYKIIVPTE